MIVCPASPPAHSTIWCEQKRKVHENVTREQALLRTEGQEVAEVFPFPYFVSDFCINLFTDGLFKHSSVTLPILDDAEIKTGKVTGDEGLKDTDDPASIKLTVSICHLQTHTHTPVVFNSIQMVPAVRQTC